MYKRVNELLGTNFNSNDEIPWSFLSSSMRLSESFIREFEDKVDWDSISICQVLSEDFIREFEDKVYWGNISSYQLLSWDFILEFKNKISWDVISKNQFLIDPNYERINKKLLKRNKLYHLYQQTKNRGWFVGYILNDGHVLLKNKKLIYFYINSGQTHRTKTKIYWKDIKLTNMISEFEIIRKIKYV